jgi:hypothetical protein
MAIAKDVNCSLAKLSAVIERDPALAAGILKLPTAPCTAPPAAPAASARPSSAWA